jgi:uncharacterized protein
MMTVFADTSYYIALVNPRDEFSSEAIRVTEQLRGTCLTTAWVITELGNFFSGAENRPLFLELLAELHRDDSVHVVPPTLELFNAGLDLYARRMDKDWSLTDCISFEIMRRHQISDALTTDHHFEQAGFRALLKS